MTDPAVARMRFDVTVRRGETVVTATGAVQAGECLALVGPSGAGKTTMLAALAGLVPLDRGAVWLGGELLSRGRQGRYRAWAVPLHRRGTTLVAQPPALFPNLDVAANIGFGLAGGPSHPLVAALAERLELTDQLSAAPARLSGGQRQRVALARALAVRPRALLLDEPFTGLDPALRERVADVLAEELAAAAIPCVLVTHDLAEAQRWGDQVAVMDGGRILQMAPPAVLAGAPATRRVAELTGYSAFVPTDAVRPASTDIGAPAGAQTVAVHPGVARWKMADQVGGGGPSLAGGWAAEAVGSPGGAHPPPGSGGLPQACAAVSPGVDCVSVAGTVVAVRPDGPALVAVIEIGSGAAGPAGAAGCYEAANTAGAGPASAVGSGAGGAAGGVISLVVAAGTAAPAVGAAVVVDVPGPPCFDGTGRLVGHWGRGR